MNAAALLLTRTQRLDRCCCWLCVAGRCCGCWAGAWRRPTAAASHAVANFRPPLLQPGVLPARALLEHIQGLGVVQQDVHEAAGRMVRCRRDEGCR